VTMTDPTGTPEERDLAFCARAAKLRCKIRNGHLCWGPVCNCFDKITRKCWDIAAKNHVLSSLPDYDPIITVNGW
jgi:hypothetical protein